MNQSLLLVEDDVQMQEELSAIFRAHNIFTLSATTGEASLSLAEQRTFDTALVDIKLPDCSGVDLIDRLKQKTPDTVFILMTAYASLDTALQALRHGVLDYVLKPFGPEEIVKTVQRSFEFKDLLKRDRDHVQRIEFQNQILEEKIAYLRKLNEVFVGREERVNELKREVNQLLVKNNQPPKYEGI